VRVLLVAALLVLGGCQLDDPIAWGTVVSVQEKYVVESVEDSGKHYEHPFVLEVAWKVEVRLDDGATVTQDSSRRYTPGERVPVLIPVAHALPQE
jgi:hypothetical protein